MRKKGLFAPLTAVFFLLCSCAYKEQLAFMVGSLPLYSLSKEAEDGVLSLSDRARLEYSFETPLMPEEDTSLEIEYRLQFSLSQNPGADGPVILELGKDAWELPVDFSFLGGLVSGDAFNPANDEFIVRYAVPLPAGEPVKKISISNNTPASQKKEDAPLFEIKDFSIVQRRFGFSSGDTAGITRSFSLSPFVYVTNSALIIDPQPRFRSPGGMELLLFSAEKPVSLKAGNTAIESSSSRLTVPALLISKDESFPLSINAGEKINEVRLIPAQAIGFPAPIPADPGMVLSWPRREWRDSRYELFAWEDFPSILIFDFADYNIQDRFLKRLAFFVEKAGYRGRIVPYSSIAELHGWNAHDYRASSLADFFETAGKQNLPLLDEEKELEGILLDSGIIRRLRDGSIVPGEGAIVSISRQSPEYLRHTFMVHEGYHGLYFIDGEFRDFCRRRWEAFRNPGRRFLLSFFDFQRYDTSDTDLVINEFMAYLLQQGVSRAGVYFGEIRANEMITISPWRRAYLPEREEVLPSGNLFWPEIAEAFTAEAAVFSRYVNDRWGFAAGSVVKTSIR